MSTGKQPDWRTKPREDQSPTVIGNAKNFWKWSKEEGFDLTHPPTPDSEPAEHRLRLQCAMTPVVIDPTKTALLIIDLQNYDLHEALGNNNAEFYRAEDTVLKHAIPAARAAGIQIIWITTGYSDDDLAEMDPGVFRTFNFEPVSVSPDWQKLPPGEAWSKNGMYRNQKGVGDEIGEVKDKNGKVINAGRILVKGSWSSWHHDPLSDAYDEGKSATPPDVHFYKNRSSGMCERMKDVTDFLKANNLMSLLFTGINIDQCVMGTLQDAYLKGFDTILLKDGCATDSPWYCQWSVESNCLVSWGFLSSCKDLSKAVGLKVEQGDGDENPKTSHWLGQAGCSLL
ncbi:Isochorismatase-like protein [Podospora aff. communis PSN243]|uniref:Isochorismatase-like protein n=1 Tax=Podospora aff. communis PSN243 TaxID=3040156 RepID=A0AAV9GDF9_9PEZI|nr:Isochorismatase-like protein [Podospora aff. communis PSN243]